MKNINKLLVNYLDVSDDVVIGLNNLNSFSKYIKITKANLSLHINALGSNSIRFDYGNPVIWENVEQISFYQDDSSFDIDVTDELQDCLDRNITNFILHLTYLTEKNNEHYVTIDATRSSIWIEYISKEEFKDHGKYENLDLGNAGSATIDLATGILNINKNLAKFTDNSLSTNIYLNYSNLNNYEQRKIILNGNEITLPDVKCGQGNFLNLNQYIITSKNENFNDYMYIDENGKQHLLNKRYYRKGTLPRIYIPKENLYLNADGSVYTIIDGQSDYNLEYDYEDELGLELVEDISTYKNFKQFAENDDYIKLLAEKDAVDNSIVNLNNNLKTYKEQLVNVLVGKKYYEERLGDMYSNWHEKNIVDITQLFTSSELELIDDFNLLNDMRTLSNIIVANYNVGKVPNDNDWWNLSSDKVLFETKDIGGYTVQINSLTDTIRQIQYELDEYVNRKTKIENQILQYKLIKPIYYLVAGKKVYGFAESYDYSLAEFNSISYKIYRLVLISDNYENYININYESLGSSIIKSITNSQDEILKFEYLSEELNKIFNNYININIKYDNTRLLYVTNGNLDEVENSMIAYYEPRYNDCYINIYDNLNNLVAVVSANGLGYKFYYQNNRIIKVQKLSVFDKVLNNKVLLKTPLSLLNVSDENPINEIDTYLLDNVIEFVYYDYKSTHVTYDHKKTYTYLFDKYGNITTKYKNNLDLQTGEFIADVEQYEYNDDEISNSSVIDKSAKNFLTQKFSGATTIIESEHYFGDGAFCGDDIYLTSFERNLNNIFEVTGSVCIELNQDEINAMVASNHDYFVISGWAKANSASIDYHSDSRYGRKFQYRVVINDSYEYTRERSFDWMNTEWQYCSLGFTIKGIDNINSIKIYFDYVNNTGSALVITPKLQVGKFIEQQYRNKLLIGIANYDYEYTYTRYYYSDDETMIAKATGFVDINDVPHLIKTIYDYNENGSLIKETIINSRYDRTLSEYFVDCKRIIENKYNNRGMLVSTKMYDDKDPTTCFYLENEYDKKGNETTAVNDFGEKEDESSIVDGYGADDNLLHSSSATIDGLENKNTFLYDRNVLTEITHNDFSIKYNYDNKLRPTSIKIENDTYCEYLYNDNSTTLTLPNNDIITTDFDEDGNILNKKYNNTLVKSNIYNLSGKVLCSNDYINIQASNDPNITNSEKTTFEYDENGNLIQKLIANEINNQSTEKLIIDNTYNKNGQLSETTINFGNESQDYLYSYKDNSLDNLIESISLSGNNLNMYTQNISYDMLDRTKEIKTTVDNKIFTKQYSYLKKGDHTSNLISAEWFALSGLNKGVIHYTYDKRGNIIKIKNNGEFAVSFEYDELSRITRENNKKQNYTKTYQYDAGGNILFSKKYFFTIQSLDDESPIEIKRYNYKSNGWKDQLMGFIKKQINYSTFEETINEFEIGSYDSLGNPSIYKNKNLTWTMGRCLSSYDGNTFAYNADGIRTRKNNTSYILDGNRILSQTDGTNTLVFQYGVNGLVGFTLNGTQYIYQKNILGDIIGIFDSNQQLVAKYAYDAWGNQTVYAKINSEMIDITGQSMYNGNISNINPFRYRGYYYDVETGLYYLNSRYYDPEIGRFVNADDISYINPNLINGLNLYAYCGDNPIKNVDKNGKFFLSFLIAFAVGAAVSALVSVGSQLITGNNSVNGWKVLSDAFFGGITGLLTLSGLSIVGGFFAFGTVGALNSIVNGAIDGNIIAVDVLSSFLVSGIFGGVSSWLSGAEMFKGVSKTVLNRLNQLEHNFINDISKKGFSYAFRSSSKYIKEFIKPSIFNAWNDVTNGILEWIMTKVFGYLAEATAIYG